MEELRRHVLDREGKGDLRVVKGPNAAPCQRASGGNVRCVLPRDASIRPWGAEMARLLTGPREVSGSQ